MGAVSPEKTARWLAAAEPTTFTYVGTGATRNNEAPTGFHALERAVEIGSGRDVFDRAATQLKAWGVQRAAGFQVLGPLEVTAGATALLVMAVGPVKFVAPIRVVYWIEEADHIAFAYGTLPGHPESGEEYFGLTIDETERVRFRVNAFSRAGSLMTHIGQPVVRKIQERATQQYMDALQ